MALTPEQHQAKAEEILDTLEGIRLNSPSFLPLTTLAQIHATLATLETLKPAPKAPTKAANTATKNLDEAAVRT